MTPARGNGAKYNPRKDVGIRWFKEAGISSMHKTVGYLITWTTYGTWLQGESKGYVKNGKVLKGDAELKKANEDNLKSEPVKLTREQKEVVRKAILEASKRFNQKIYSIAVYSNHVHIAAEYVDVPISVIVAYYKNASRVALNIGRVWTSGYDKRYCFDEKVLKERISYVERHNN